MVHRGSNFARSSPGWVAVVLFLLLAATPGAPGVAGSRDQPRRLADWYKGPVRYLSNRSETKQFKRLKTDSERVVFIRRFWDRRDPDPRTPQNEARAAFWRRVAESNRLFNETPTPGWKTDRGKIYVLLGPPDDREQKLNYDTGIREVAARGLLRWHYHGLERATTRAVTVIAFVRQPDEDWALTTDPKLSSIFLDVNSPDLPGLPSYMERLLDEVPWGGGTMGTAMDLGRLQEVPTERDLLKSVVRAEQFLGTYDGAATTHTLTTRAGQTVLMLTIAVLRSDLTPPWDGSATGLAQRFAVTAELRPSEKRVREQLPIEIPDAAWVAEPAPIAGDPWLRFQARRAVPEGEWTLSAVIVDRPGGGASAIYRDVSVPPSEPSRPILNGPFLASAILPGGNTDTENLPFRFGDHLVLPRMDSRLASSEPFNLSIEVFSPPGTDQPVALDWQFYRIDDEAQPVPFGPPGHLDDGRGSRAWERQARDLPPGRYKLTFVATTDGGLPRTKSLEFEVLSATESVADSR